MELIINRYLLGRKHQITVKWPMEALVWGLVEKHGVDQKLLFVGKKTEN